MSYQIGILTLVLCIFQPLNAVTLPTDNILIPPGDLVAFLDSNKNQSNQIENFSNEKLQWQIKAYEKWYRDGKGSQDISFIFDDWTPIERRFNGSVDFYRNWSQYQNGFGDPQEEFFIGFENLLKLYKNNDTLELLVVLGHNTNIVTYAKYDNFVLGSNVEKYMIKRLGQYTGTAGDWLRPQERQRFSTSDQENDASIIHNCAEFWKSAWWFGDCFESHLHGPYSKSEHFQWGLKWDLRISELVKYTLMLVRPTRDYYQDFINKPFFSPIHKNKT